MTLEKIAEELKDGKKPQFDRNDEALFCEIAACLCHYGSIYRKSTSQDVFPSLYEEIEHNGKALNYLIHVLTEDEVDKNKALRYVLTHSGKVWTGMRFKDIPLSWRSNLQLYLGILLYANQMDEDILELIQIENSCEKDYARIMADSEIIMNMRGAEYLILKVGYLSAQQKKRVIKKLGNVKNSTHKILKSVCYARESKRKFALALLMLFFILYFIAIAIAESYGWVKGVNIGGLLLVYLAFMFLRNKIIGK